MMVIFDGCIRADPSLHNKPLPFSLKLNEFCFVEVSIEIGPSQCHHISTIFFRLANFTNNIVILGVLIIWEWYDVDDGDDILDEFEQVARENDVLSTDSDLIEVSSSTVSV